jgi:hypothetical protein
VAKVVVTFKLEEGIYSKQGNVARNERRGDSEIVREGLTDRLRKKNSAFASDFITFIEEQKTSGKTWMGPPLCAMEMWHFLKQRVIHITFKNRVILCCNNTIYMLIFANDQATLRIELGLCK